MAQSLAREKILFLINPNSGTKYKGRLPELIKKLTDPVIFEVEVHFTKFKGEATELVSQKLLEGFRYFVAVGGDGTINEIGKVLINTEAILGIIPVGSGNGLARHLKIPLDPLKAIQIINHLNIKAIDYGIINNMPFFCTCGVGFDALIGEKFDQNKRRGLTSYIKTVISEFFNFQPETYQITINNQQKKELKAFLITFANASQYGNNALIAPKAEICDGELEICILSPFPFYKALLIGIRLFSGNIDRSQYIAYHKARKIYVERASEAIIHIDGETRRPGKNLDITMISKGLRVIVP